jgi:anthranilate phosphoribosyltransferase
MATEGTKFQINYKLNDGTLINLYAATVQELETGLTDLSMVSTLIKSTGAELAGVPAQAAPTVAAVAQQFNATPVAAAPVSQGGANTCKHGQMALRSGVGQKGPWSGYMCAAPKGAPDKCETIWVR